MHRSKYLIAAILLISAAVWLSYLIADRGAAEHSGYAIENNNALGKSHSVDLENGAARDTMNGSQLYEKYLSMRDKYAAYQWFKQRPELEAKYFAYQSVRDCQVIAGDGADNIADWHDIEFIFKQTIANGDQRNRLSLETRTKAFSKLTMMCRGFSRPNSFPKDDELASLLKEAAGTSLAATVLSMRWGEISTENQKNIVKEIFASSDASGLREAIPYIWGNRSNLRNEYSSSSDQVLQAALDITSCLIGNPCDVDRNSVVQAACAFGGICNDEDNPYLVWTRDLSSSERDEAISLAMKFADSFHSGSSNEIFK